ncbi:hypothetical protein VSS93_28685, partial [Pseudomonas syringae pv. tagetis]
MWVGVGVGVLVVLFVVWGGRGLFGGVFWVVVLVLGGVVVVVVGCVLVGVWVVVGLGALFGGWYGWGSAG